MSRKERRHDGVDRHVSSIHGWSKKIKVQASFRQRGVCGVWNVACVDLQLPPLCNTV